MSIRKLILVLLALALFVTPTHAAARHRISAMAPGGNVTSATTLQSVQ